MNDHIGAFAQAIADFGVDDFTRAISDLFREQSFTWQVEYKGEVLDCPVTTDENLVKRQDKIRRSPASVSVDFDEDPSNGDGYDTDLLGVYVSKADSAEIGEIILYSKPITRVAEKLEVDGNELASVVLYHELAHFAVHVIKGDRYSGYSDEYHEQWAQCLAYWAMPKELRGVFIALEEKQRGTMYELDDDLKDFLTEPVSATHATLMNLLNTDCLPSIGLAEGERDGVADKLRIGKKLLSDSDEQEKTDLKL